MATTKVIADFWQDPLRPIASQSVLSFFKINGLQRNIIKARLATGRRLKVEGGYRALTATALQEKETALAELEKKYSVRADVTVEERAALRLWFATRKKEMAILQAAYQLQQGQKCGEQFNQACQGLYGQYNVPLFAEFLDQLLHTVDPKKQKSFKKIQQDIDFEYLIGYQRGAYTEPTAATFAHYKALARPIVSEIRQVVNKYVEPKQRVVSSEVVQQIIDELLVQIHATELGWRTQTREYVHKLSVNARSKTVYIKKDSFRLTRRRLCGVMAHEVYIHVRRKMHDEPLHMLIAEALPESAAFEEGLGVVAEQLCLERYYPLRQFRFLAIGLAMGADGRPRNLAQVYEVLWRLRYISGNYSSRAAKNYAFDEALRAFRGTPLHTRGIAYSRDKIYTEGNASIWRRLEYSLLGSAAFQLFLTSGRHL